MSRKKRSNILITGASSGLGEGMAREFADKGRNLALCARRDENLYQLKQELTQPGRSPVVLTKPLDVTDYDAVFRVFEEFRAEFGEIDRIIVNAGIGDGAAIGTGGFAANLRTAETNFVAALAQMEAAMAIFRQQGYGHLVVISSVSAYRGMPKDINVYAATKAAVASMAEGLRMELAGRSAIKVSTIFPGYILTAINAEVKNAPFRVDADSGCKALVKAIEAEVDTASVPSWPWMPLGAAMRNLPTNLVRKMF